MILSPIWILEVELEGLERHLDSYLKHPVWMLLPLQSLSQVDQQYD